MSKIGRQEYAKNPDTRPLLTRVRDERLVLQMGDRAEVAARLEVAEKHVSDLEDTVARLKDQRDTARIELRQAKNTIAQQRRVLGGDAGA